jgi:hypothetical protein
MRSAATAAVLAICVLALGGQFNSAATAGVQLDPLDTVTSDLNTGVTGATDSVTGAVNDSVTGATDSVTGATDSVTGATDSVTGAVNDSVTGATGNVTGAVNDAGSAVDGSASGSGATGVFSGSGSAATSSSTGGSGSASSGDSSTSARSAKASNRGSPHTRFDRLPPRYEKLLERIESGRHVRASVARLRALLASASPELRARIMRAVRMELRRLEKGGLTRREHAAAERLRRLLPMPGGAASSQLTQVSRTQFGPSGAASSLSAGDGSVQAAGATAASPPLADHPPPNGEAGTTHGLPGPLFPLPSPSGTAYWLLLLAAIAAVLLLVPWAPRRLIPSSVRGIVEVREASLALTIGLVLGVGVAFLLQALP